MSQTLKSDSVYLRWKEKWNETTGKLMRPVAEKDVCKTGRTLKEKGFRKVLDLGCGSGRHALWFAQLGFEVHAYDVSATNLEDLTAKTTSENLKIKTQQDSLENLPYPNAYFDYVLAWESISHGDVRKVQDTITEVYRILRPGGIFQGTMVSKRNIGQLAGKNNSLYPYIENLGTKDMLYCYSAIELVHILTGFEILKLKDKEHKNNGSYHWHFVAEKG